MSIAVLTQVYDEVRRLAIAGSALAAGDFRLKKLVAPLEASAQKAPVFGKVAQAIQKVLESSSEESAAALLELSTLTSAILYTQGETGIQGTLEPIASTDMGLTISATSARVLKPLLEALTTSGSGHLEIVRDAFERGAFKDLRLIKPTLKALDHTYSEIGDLVAGKILPMYGKAIYGEVKAGFDQKGKGDDARRLKLMHQLDPDSTHELVEQSLEEGSKEVKLAALECLSGREDSIPYLLEQAKAKAKEVRAAALQGLATFTNDQVVDVLTKALGSADVGLVAEHVHANASPKLQKFVLEQAEKLRDGLLAGKSKDKALQKTQLEQLDSLLEALARRTDAPAEKFLTGLFEQRDKLAGLQAGYVSGSGVISTVCRLLLLTKSKSALKLLVDSRAAVAPEHVGFCFLAAARSAKPREVYAQFSPIYLSRPEGKKKEAELARERSDAISGMLRSVGSGHYWGRDYEDEFYQGVELDPQWLDAAIQISDVHTILALSRPKYAPLLKYFEGYVDAELAKKKFEPDYLFDDVVEKMIDMEHPGATDRVVAVFEKPYSAARGHYWLWSIARLISKLPKDAAPRFEALLPNLNEKVVDMVLPHLDELKRK